MTYFYDKQIRRYISQFLRIFSDIKYRSEPDENGFSLESRVPIKYGDMSRLVGSIITSNTENVTIPMPNMAGYVTALKLDPNRRKDPSMITKAQVSEPFFNETTQEYEAKIGNSYTVERFMPVPYRLEMKVDILTSNTDSKLQIMEQIMTIFNPTIELQQNENVIDWSRIFQVELLNINWSNRSIPMGDSLDYDVATVEFYIPIWINPPAKEKRQRIIETIVTRIFDTDEEPLDWENPFDNEIAQIIVTSENLHMRVTYDNSIEKYIGQLLDPNGVLNPATNWASKINNVGSIIPDSSRLKIRLSDDLDDESMDVYAIINGIDETDPTKMQFTLDDDSLPPTIPQSPITAIINPLLTYDGSGIDTGDLSITHRYMVLGGDSNDPAINSANVNWGGITAYANDVIEYSGGQWVVIFESRESPEGVHIENLADGNHYTFDGTKWVYTLLGVISPGYWSILDIKKA